LEPPLGALGSLDALQNDVLGLVRVAPAERLHPFELFEVLVVLEKVLDLL
jgi:hypothetical protein